LEQHAVDDFRCFVCPLAPGRGHILYTRGIHPHPSARGFSHFRNELDSGPQADGLVPKAKNMKPIIWIGILLIVLGGLALAYQGFTYTHEEKVLDIGPIHATREDHERVSIPPILGGLALVGGIALIVVGGKKGS
jgi:uncharacterized membrane protein